MLLEVVVELELLFAVVLAAYLADQHRADLQENMRVDNGGEYVLAN